MSVIVVTKCAELSFTNMIFTITANVNLKEKRNIRKIHKVNSRPWYGMVIVYLI